MPQKTFEWKHEAKEFAQKLKKSGMHNIKILPIIRSISGVRLKDGIKAVGRIQESRVVGYAVRWSKYKGS